MAKRNPVTAHGLSKGGDMKYADDNEYNEEGKTEKGGGFRKGEDGKMYKMQKAMLTTDDLQKSLDKLSAFATEDDGVTRKEELLEKAQHGELDESERDELFKALGGSAEPAHSPESITSGFSENDTLRKALDVSDFLAEQQSELVKALGSLEDRQDSSDQRQHDFNILMAKAVTNVGTLVKSVHDTLQVIAGQPVRGPRAKGANAPARAPQALEKSFGGAPPENEQLTKPVMAKALQELFEERIDKSNSSKLSNGIDLLTEISKFESYGQLHPSVDDLVKSRVNQQRQAH